MNDHVGLTRLAHIPISASVRRHLDFSELTLSCPPTPWHSQQRRFMNEFLLFCVEHYVTKMYAKTSCVCVFSTYARFRRAWEKWQQNFVLDKQRQHSTASKTRTNDRIKVTNLLKPTLNLVSFDDFVGPQPVAGYTNHNLIGNCEYDDAEMVPWPRIIFHQQSVLGTNLALSQPKCIVKLSPRYPMPFMVKIFQVVLLSLFRCWRWKR